MDSSTSQPVVVIASYKPKSGKALELQTLLRAHLPILRSIDLVTDRESIMMEAADGTIVEVFEWRSQEAINSAHNHPKVLAMWAKYAEVCEYIPVGSVPESVQMFPSFRPFK